jgi:hypothetical protein
MVRVLRYIWYVLVPKKSAVNMRAGVVPEYAVSLRMTGL